MAYSPIVTPHRTVTLAPMLAPRSTRVSTRTQSSLVARGNRSLVKVADGPTNTSSAIVTPLYTFTLLAILQRSPITAPSSTNTFRARLVPAPTRAPRRTPSAISAPSSISAVGWTRADGWTVGGGSIGTAARYQPADILLGVTDLDDIHEASTTAPAGSTSPSAPGAVVDRVHDLELELVGVRQQLWEARDAVIGATATAGSVRARNVELEMLVHQLRTALAQRDVELAAARRSITGRVSTAKRGARRFAGRIKRLLLS